MAEIFIPLSPAESLLLFNNGYSSRQALKVTLLELIARKILRVETRQEQRVFRKEAVQYLRVLVHHVPGHQPDDRFVGIEHAGGEAE